MCICIIFFCIGLMPVGVGRSSPTMFHPLFVLHFQFSESAFTSVHVFSPRHRTRIAFPVVSLYYRFHRIHSRTLFLHSLSPCRLHIKDTSISWAIMQSWAEQREHGDSHGGHGHTIGHIAGQLRCHTRNEYNHRPEIADSDQNSILVDGKENRECESPWGHV